MDKAVFDTIKNKVLNYKYSSLNYTEYKDVEYYNFQADSDDLILMLGYNREAKLHEYLWATNKADTMINALKYKGEYILSFVPPKWVPMLEEVGLQARNAWHDYFLIDLDKKNLKLTLTMIFLNLMK